MLGVLLVPFFVQWMGFVTGELVKVAVPVFSDYLLICNISKLPENPRLTDFQWFRDHGHIPGINGFLQPHGGILFRQIGPSAGGIYQCCYNGTLKLSCSKETLLFVKGKPSKVIKGVPGDCLSLNLSNIS